MTFRKFEAPKYPRRQWLIEGAAGAGKSTFATQMKPALLPIDADQRFAEVLSLVKGQVFQLSNEPADNIQVDRIAELLRANMVGSGVGTIVVDSLTAIIAPLVITALRNNDAGRNTNKVAAYKDKATAMRLLQDAITGWGRTWPGFTTWSRAATPRRSRSPTPPSLPWSWPASCARST